MIFDDPITDLKERIAALKACTTKSPSFERMRDLQVQDLEKRLKDLISKLEQYT